MPSKFKKAIGAVKDQTSISIAKVSNTSSANLEVTVLKATSHDVIPIENKYVQEILTLISSNKTHASSCAQAIAKRIGKTRNWIVALKSLMLVLRIFQDGDPYFPIEVLHAMKRGAKILNLSNFRDDSNSCPWDYTAFVRTFALYLDERLDCFLTGKLQRRFTYQRDQDYNNCRRSRRSNEPVAVVRDMKPAILLDRINYWQKLLDRAIGTTPTGAAKTNRLVLISLYAIVQETYDLYRDISDGLGLLLDSFFQLQYQSCVNAFHACVKASKQFEELSTFYGLCKGLGVGRTSEYPSVQKISEELLETLQEFLKDQASFPGRSPPTHLQIGSDQTRGKDKGLALDTNELASSEQLDASERGSAFGSACTSLEDLMSVSDQNGNVSPAWSVEQEFYNTEENPIPEKPTMEQPAPEKLTVEQPIPDKPAVDELARRTKDNGSNQSLPVDKTSNSGFELVSFEDGPSLQSKPEHIKPPELEGGLEISGVDDGPNRGWEVFLFESANNQQQPLQSTSTSPGPLSIENLFDSSSNLDSSFAQTSQVPQHRYNPFLEDEIQIHSFPSSSTASTTTISFGNFRDDGFFSFPSTSQAMGSTFFAHNTNDATMAPAFGDPSPKQSTFGEHNSNQSTVVTTFPAHNSNHNATSPTQQSPKEGTISLWWQHANESPKENKMASLTFYARDDSHVRATSPTFGPQSPRESRMALACSAVNHNNTAMVAHSQNQSTMTPPTFYARDTNERTVSPEFNPQSPIDSRMAPSFSAANHNENAMAARSPNENARASLAFGPPSPMESRMANHNGFTMGAESPKHNTMESSAFYAQHSNERTMSSTFGPQSSMESRMAPTFSAAHHNDARVVAKSPKENTMGSPLYYAQDTNESTMSPTYGPQSPIDNIMTSTFSAANHNDTRMVAQCPKENIMASTTSYARDTNERTMSSTFDSQSPRDRRMSPSFSAANYNDFRMAPPTFCSRNTHERAMSQTFGPQSPVDRRMERSFSAANQNDFTMVTPRFYSRDTNERTLSQTFGPQSPVDRRMERSFSAANHNDFTMATPTFYSRGTNEQTMSQTIGPQSPVDRRMAPSFSPSNPNHFTMATPTFYSQDANERTMSPTFGPQSPPDRRMAPSFSVANNNDVTMEAQSPKNHTMVSSTFYSRDTNERAMSPPTYSPQSPIDNKRAPSFSASLPTFSTRDTNERAMSPPTYSPQSPIDNRAGPSFSATQPTFSARDTNERAMSPTNSPQSPVDNRTSPSFSATSPTFGARNTNQRTMSPTISPQGSIESRMSPSFSAVNRDNEGVSPPSFWAQNRPQPTFRANEQPNDQFTAGPTFSVHNLHSDPFGNFSNATTSEPVCNGFNQESVLHQQRLWLEQQNKIIAKHLT